MSRLLFLAPLAFSLFAQTPLLLQEPAVSKDHIVFVYAGDLWRVARAGGDAVRLTTGAGVESHPVFSPDGGLVAFSGVYDGNRDVYSVAVGGGVPRRLTWHPSADTPVGFTPDGKQILFASGRNQATPGSRLYTIPVSGGFPVALPLPLAEDGSYAAGAARIAYTPLRPAFDTWKRYRGGRTSPIWIADLATSKIEKLPRENSNDYYPMWIGGKIWFLSDRGGNFTLWSYDTATKRVTEAIQNSGFDYKSASAGPGAIVLDHLGSIELFDLKTGKPRKVEIRLSGDLPSVRPYYDRVARLIDSYEISPTGARAVFSARGDIFTVPVEKGDVRNLTSTPGIAERAPAWSPDGKEIAYFSDESGEYQLHVRGQSGLGEVKKYGLGKKAFFWEARWSPDGKKLLVRDSELDISLFDLEAKQLTRIDTDYYDFPGREAIEPRWSPDSKWVVYCKLLPNRLRAVFVYSLDARKSTQLTDGLSDVRGAAFDKNGKYIYFTASTNVGLGSSWLDMTSVERISNRSVYIAVLRKDDPSPLAPESDEEKAEPAKKEEPKKDEAKKGVEVRIDFEGISQRILALPIPARNYGELATAKEGVVFLLEAPATPSFAGPPANTLHKFDLKTRKTEKFLDGVRSFAVSFNGEKMLYFLGERGFIAGTAATPKPGDGALKLEQMEARVDPPAEWRQIYREVWRIQRDFLYDPNAHGLDLAAAEKKYEPFLAGVAHREDLNYLLRDGLGDISLGHLRIGGGALPEVKTVPGGLLGADYSIENGRYRFAKVFDGENWNPQLRAPLTQPGVNVKAGEYLLAVNGRDLTATDNIYSFFEATAGKSVTLRAGPNPGAEGSREVTVVPVAEEYGLRNLDWMEGNRRKVDRLSNGRLGYVYLPNTSINGYQNFNRWFFSQIEREGMVVDERFNGGGLIADYIVDYLRRPLTNFFSTRAGHDFMTPGNVIRGPKAMIVNEYAGSGGDAMPWLFRQHKIGPLIGKRTWGGLVGIFGFPRLVDGGSVTAPNLAFYNLKGDWEVENAGVAPDIEVEYDPAAVRQGRDPQLEKAVEVLLDELKRHPLPQYKKPAYPNYHKQ